MDAYSRQRAAIKRWNRRNYKEFKLRIHRGSDLEERMAAYAAEGGSLSFLMAVLLSHHFECKLPYKKTYFTKRVQLV